MPWFGPMPGWLCPAKFMPGGAESVRSGSAAPVRYICISIEARSQPGPSRRHHAARHQTIMMMQLYIAIYASVDLSATELRTF